MSLCLAMQDLYPAWTEQGLEWMALHGQQAAESDSSPMPAAQTAPLPQDLVLSPEQLQLVTEYFQKAS